ncbi:ANTAR domain-containing protein [Streptomyces sp. DSM 118878]
MTARPGAAVIAARYAGRAHPARLISEACRTALHGEYSVGLTLAARSAYADRVSLSATGLLAGPGESLQISLGEGPCVQALSRHAPVVVDDVDVADATRQWPLFALRAREHGIRALYALPGQDGSVSARPTDLVLTLYRDRPGPASDGDLETARDHAAAADLLLVSPAAWSPTPSTVPSGEDPDDAWLVPGPAVVHQAIGVLSYRHAVSTGEALALLRAHTRRLGTDLPSLAHAVVHEKRELPGPPGPASSGPPSPGPPRT